VKLENVGRSIRGLVGFIDSGCGEDNQVCEVIVFDRVRRSDQPSLIGSMKGMSEKTKIFFDLVTIMIYSLRAMPGLALGICMAAIQVCIIRHNISLEELIVPNSKDCCVTPFVMELLDPMPLLQMIPALVGHRKVTFIGKITTDPTTAQAIHFTQSALSIYAEHTTLSFK
jgi:hypothetical protein